MPLALELGGIHDPQVRRALEVLSQQFPVRAGLFTTALRPSAVTLGRGAEIYDTTLNKPVWSDGTNWRDAAGTIV
jgi:hypothetical protein